MKENYAAGLFKYCSPKSILVLTWYNKLVEIHCPFKVNVKGDIGGLRKGQKVDVSAVKVSSNGRTVFEIAGKPYYYFHFDIIVNPV
ncbi:MULTISPECIES: hypothetical protein [Pseudotamlana]|uniref:Uncharacterized protein n=1 Tax=Pseudotamlana carrageenivorans TaxID=2069432 RepID=A0A2I7SGW2_9FLAO|nr:MULTISPECIES: hypothetical protein [Tamlana]AUS05120.1 hypothetical protein C1A40_06395 [Tamlana carrageenivorans]